MVVSKRTLKAPMLVVIAMLAALLIAVVAVYVHTVIFVKYEKTFLYSGVEYAFENDDKSDGSNIFVVGYNGSRARIVIPEFIEGHRVTHIAKGAFRGNRSLTSIGFETDIPVSDNAFEGCVNLRSVDFGHITQIGKAAFKNCKSLESAQIIPEIEVIPSETFYGCSALASIEVAESAETIKVGTKAFGNCDNLRSVEFGRRIDYSYNNGARNFFEGSAVKKLHLVDFATADEYSLSTASSLFGIDRANSISDVSLGELIIDRLDGLPFGFCENLPITRFEVKSIDDTFISANAFKGCANLKEFKLPAGVQATGVGVSAFAGTALERFNGNMLESIEEGAFKDCASLTSITLSGNRALRYFGNYAFAGCSSLASVNIPAAVTEMSEGLFDGCTALAEVRFVNSAVITAIGDNAFRNCSALPELVVPGEGLTSIGSSSFAGCTAFTEYAVPQTVYIIGQDAFADCTGLTEFTAGDNVTYIGLGALSGCTALESVTLPFVGNTRELNRHFTYVFGASTTYYDKNEYVPQSLETVVITGGEVIAPRAFALCADIVSISLPDTLTEIGDGAFVGCEGLTELVIPDSVESIGFGAFDGCNGLETLSVPFVGTMDAETYSSYFSYMFGSTDPLDHTNVPTSLTTVTVTSATALYANAFYGCYSIRNIELPDTLQAIYAGAFTRCYGLTELVIPDSVVNLGRGIICGATGLRSLTTPFVGSSRVGSYNYNTPSAERRLDYLFTDDNGSSMMNSLKTLTITDSEYIPSGAFFDCYFLERLILDCDITAVGEDAFYGCYKLYEIFNYSREISITEGFTNHGGIAQYALKVHTDREEEPLPTIEIDECRFIADEAGNWYLIDYERANMTEMSDISLPSVVAVGQTRIDSYAIWQFFLRGVEYGIKTVNIPSTVTAVGAGAFAYCQSLESVVFATGSPVTAINDNTFVGDCRLYEFVQPQNLTRIGTAAFMGCSRLKKITIPQTMPEDGIGIDAFFGCTRLFEVYNLSSLNITVGSSAYGDVALYARAVHRNLSQALDSKIVGGVHYIKLGINNIDFWAVDYYGTDGELAIIPFEYNGVTISRLAIYDTAFRGYNEISSLTVSSAVSRISDEFAGCGGITEVRLIGGGIYDAIEIAENAMSGLFGLRSFRADVPVSTIGANAFANCGQLVTVEFASVDTIGDNAFAGCDNLETVVFGNTNTIGANAFAYNIKLKSVTFGNVGAIGYGAFSYNEALTDVTFGNIENTGESAFYCCTALRNATFGNVRLIGELTFSCCTALVGINIGDGYELTIGRRAFNGCTALTAFEHRGDIIEIEMSAFADCYGLTRVALGKVGTIGHTAFTGCNSLTSLSFGGNVGTVAMNAFSYSALEEIVFGSEVGIVENNAFVNINGLRAVTFNGNVGEIGDYAFSGSSVADVTFGGSLSSMGVGAFMSCWALEEIALPDSLARIGDSAFQFCNSLHKVTLPRGLTELSRTAFDGSYYIFVVCNRSGMSESQLVQYFSVPPVIITNDSAQTTYSLYDDSQYRAVKVNGVWYVYNVFATNGFYMLPDGFTANGDNVSHYILRANTTNNSDYGTNIYIPLSVASIQPTALKAGCTVYYRGDAAGWNRVKPTDADEQVSAVLYYSACVHDGDIAKWRFDFSGLPTTEVTVLNESLWSVTTQPTCVTEGFESATCPNCNRTVRRSIGYAPHDIVDGKCTVCGRVSVVITAANMSTVTACTITDDETYPFAASGVQFTSSNKSDDSVSALTLVANKQMTVSFHYNVSSESGYDYFVLKVNGAEIMRQSGNDASDVNVELGARDKLEFVYLKDGSQSSGRDNVIISNLTLVFAED